MIDREVDAVEHPLLAVGLEEAFDLHCGWTAKTPAFLDAAVDEVVHNGFLTHNDDPGLRPKARHDAGAKIRKASAATPMTTRVAPTAMTVIAMACWNPYWNSLVIATAMAW